MNVGACHSREAVEERVGRMRIKEFSVSVEGTAQNSSISHQRATGTVNLEAYENIPVKVIGEGVPAPLTSFEEIKCHEIVQENIKKCGYTQPTPIQKHAIPICMSGRDLMASAQTGSGKTAAFCLPIIASILWDCGWSKTTRTFASCAPFALVLSPTRELTCQIHAEAKKFSDQTSLRVAVVYGGTPIGAQINQLRQGADILVATPGRLKDLIERKKVSLSQVKYLVLDEADRMLDMGFEPQIRCIVEEADMPSVDQRQTMLFSATFPEEIKELARNFLSNSIFISVGRVGSSTNLILQKVEYVDEFNKRNSLLELVKVQQMNNGNTGKVLAINVNLLILDKAFGVIKKAKSITYVNELKLELWMSLIYNCTKKQGLMVVFAETKREVDSLEKWLCQMGFRATSIHGDRTQYERDRALKSFREGKKPILIATDVAARGLDVPDVSQVVNYELPKEIDSYVHRIGRTGRAGKMGTAVSFFCDKDTSLAKPLVKLLTESKQTVPEWLLEYAAVERSNAKLIYHRRNHARRW
ncbi:hypothetical protein L7F22_005813 [Adiantum nelumboides]|nr:hypothetical protein [Adiantum nelumboides]